MKRIGFEISKDSQFTTDEIEVADTLIFFSDCSKRLFLQWGVKRRRSALQKDKSSATHNFKLLLKKDESSLDISASENDNELEHGLPPTSRPNSNNVMAKNPCRKRAPKKKTHKEIMETVGELSLKKTISTQEVEQKRKTHQDLKVDNIYKISQLELCIEQQQEQKMHTSCLSSSNSDTNSDTRSKTETTASSDKLQRCDEHEHFEKCSGSSALVRAFDKPQGHGRPMYPCLLESSFGSKKDGAKPTKYIACSGFFDLNVPQESVFGTNSSFLDLNVQHESLSGTDSSSLDLNVPHESVFGPSSSEAQPDVSLVSDEQLKTLLEQALEETQNRWVKSQTRIKNIETTMDQVWEKCKAAAEPVLGPITVDPDSCIEDELATLFTRLASEAVKWKAQCSRDSQETTLLLADNFQEFRSADSQLREVEPAIAAHKAVLDHWPQYCAQTHEKEQMACSQVHQLMIQLQLVAAEDRIQVQAQIDQHQQQIAELHNQAMQWIIEGKTAQTKIQQLQSKVTQLQDQSHHIIDAVGPNLEKAVDEPLPTKMVQLQSVVSIKAAISGALGEWQAFQARLRLTAPAVLSTCKDQSVEPADTSKQQWLDLKVKMSLSRCFGTKQNFRSGEMLRGLVEHSTRSPVDRLRRGC